MIFFLLSFLLSWLIVGGVRMLCLHYSFLDVPNQRSSHTQPTALMGGIGFIVSFFTMIFVGIQTGYLPYYANGVWGVLAGVLVASISVIDDVSPLKPMVRLLCHVVAGVCVVLSGVHVPFALSLFWLASFVTVFVIVSAINVFNFMDGIDGYAAGIGMIGSVGLSWAFLTNGYLFEAYCLSLFSFSLLGFLLWNLPKAKIFMGDVGSAFLGLVVGLFCVRFVQAFGYHQLLVPLFLFSNFILDSGLTLLHRKRRGAKLSEAHREHYYQKLHQSGWSHLNIILLEYGQTIFGMVLMMWTITFPFSFRLVIFALFLGTFALKFLWIQQRYDNSR